MRRLLLSTALIALTVAGAFARPSDDDSPRSFGRPALVTVAPVEAVTIEAGKAANVTVRFKVADGYHVNSNKPKSDLLIPTAVTIKPSPELSVAKLNYPAGEEFALKFSPDEKLSVYAGEVAITGVIRANKRAKAGHYSLTGELRYQACNDNSCFPPKSLPLEIAVNVR